MRIVFVSFGSHIFYIWIGSNKIPFYTSDHTNSRGDKLCCAMHHFNLCLLPCLNLLIKLIQYNPVSWTLHTLSEKVFISHLASLPPQQLAKWPLRLLLKSFSSLNTSIYARLAHTFSLCSPYWGSSAGGDSCACNLKHNPLYPSALFSSYSEDGWASEGPTSCHV